jgi:hypothetical protein
MPYFTDTFGVVGAPGEIHTTQKNQLGLVARANDGNMYAYFRGVASLANTEFCVFDEAGQTARLANTSIGRPAIATAAVNATSFGWFGVTGSFPAATSANTTDNGPVYIALNAGGGQANSTVTTAKQIIGAAWRSTAVSNVATVQLFAGAFVGVADAIE